MEKIEQSQLVMKQFLLAMTIYDAGLSAHLCIALDKYKNDNNMNFFTVFESHPLSGDKLENKYGKLLADYCADNSLSIVSPHQPTFVSASKTGSYKFDFCITEQKCSDLACNARAIEDIDFFSGAPEQGHWPVILI